MIEAVIFDIDGTLVDTVDFHAQSWERTFTVFGHQIPYEQIRLQIGKGSDKLMPVFFSLEELNTSDDGQSPTFGERMRDYRRELYKREYHPRIKAFPQVRELFMTIKADGKRIALASSATKDDVTVYKQILNIEELIDAATRLAIVVVKQDRAIAFRIPDDHALRVDMARRDRLNDPEAADLVVGRDHSVARFRHVIGCALGNGVERRVRDV